VSRKEADLFYALGLQGGSLKTVLIISRDFEVTLSQVEHKPLYLGSALKQFLMY
jgi:hypothetical protein